MKCKLLISFILLFLIIIGNIGVAQQVTQTEAINAAINTMKYETRNNITIDSIKNVNKKIVGNDTLLYEVTFKDGNTVLLSGHKACIPVLGMLDFDEDIGYTSIFDENNAFFFDYFIDLYSQQVKYCFDNQGSYIVECDEWEQLLLSNASYANSRRPKVGPLTTTKWGQYKSNGWFTDNHAYNYYVTETNNACGEDIYCPAGCVAVAMAQILKYWNYPDENPSKCYQYDWNNMPDKLKKNSDNYETERNAIARLIYDCAQRLNTDYCFDECNSGAYADTLPEVLPLFGYNDAIYMERENYSTNQWNQMIRQSIDNKCPILFSGYNYELKSHSFICDGYMKRILGDDYLYHFNWGWRGSKNGWFYIDIIITYPQTYDLISFPLSQSAVFGIYPSECWDNIIMECDKYFNAGENKNYCINNNFGNNHNSYIINSGANVQIRAGNKIILSDGFHAKEGSCFFAEITSTNSSRGNNYDALYDGTLRDISHEHREATDLTHSNESLHGITIYPNPTDGMFNVSFNNPDECLKHITIVNHLGSVVVNRENPDDNVINMNNLSSGLYIVKIISDKGNVYYDKVIKN